MAKKKDAARAEAKAPPPENQALEEALNVFRRGDYVRARGLLGPLVDDASLSENARQQARDLLAATKSDRAILLTGLAALGLLCLVIAFTAFIQPR
ncbi:MAG: hypothetical protein U1E65_24000 [Myxococcota bacterium]